MSRVGKRDTCEAKSRSAARQWRRVLRASILIVVAVVAVCAIDGVLSCSRTAAPIAGGSAVPSWFEDELFSVQGYSDVRVALDGAVVGFSTTLEPSEEFAAIESLMEQKGWRLMESGVLGSGSFLKEKGACTWAWVSCVDVAGATSVVVQCAKAKAGT